MREVILAVCPICKKKKCNHTEKEQIALLRKALCENLLEKKRLEDGECDISPRGTGVQCVIPTCGAEIIETFEFGSSTPTELIPIGPGSRAYYSRRSLGFHCPHCGIRYAELPAGKMRKEYKAPEGYAQTIERAREIAAILGFPVVLIPAFALAPARKAHVAENIKEIEEKARQALDLSPVRQILVQKVPSSTRTAEKDFEKFKTQKKGFAPRRQTKY